MTLKECKHFQKKKKENLTCIKSVVYMQNWKKKPGGWSYQHVKLKVLDKKQLQR